MEIEMQTLSCLFIISLEISTSKFISIKILQLSAAVVLVFYYNNIWAQNFRMSFVNKLKKLVKTIDFFYSTEMLRYDDDNQYKTFTGGIVSIGITVTILIGFASLILNTLALNTFTISTEVVKNVVPTNSTVTVTEQTPFRFAIQVWRQNITDGKRYFDVTYRLQQTRYGQTTNLTYFPLQPCKVQFFDQYPQLVKSFDRLWANTWLCPPYGTLLDLMGKYSSEHYKSYIIQVSSCNNATDPSRPCASPQQIEDYFTANANFFYFTFYFTNTQINPDKKDYKQYYFEDQAYALFGSHLGTETFLYLTDWTVQTDYSIWPFPNIVTDSGVYAQDLGINHPFQTSINDVYLTWNIAKGTNSIIYTREVQKLSIVFSFMGGMIGAISAVLFIIKVYNNVAFQFSIAFSIFKPKYQDSKDNLNNLKNLEENSLDQNEKPSPSPETPERIQNLSMNFLIFIRFYVYKLLDYFNFQYNAPDIKYAQQCKEEILKQLNIKKLLKRIIFIEHCLTKILDDYHLDVLQLKKPETPFEVKQCRLKCESVIDNQLYYTQGSDYSQHPLANRPPIFIQNFPQTPNSIVIPDQMNSVTSQNKFRSTTKRFKSQHAIKKKKTQKTICDVQNEMFIIDVEQMRAGTPNNQHFQDAYDLNQLKIQGNRQKRLKTQAAHLMKLIATAEEGNEMSTMIWRNLQIEKKKSLVKKQLVFPGIDD